MRFDRATISLQPLTMSNCLDMALRCLAAHFRPIAAGWLFVTVPTCAIAYVLIDRLEANLFVALAAFAFATAVYSAYLIAGVAAASFGEPFTVASAWRRALADGGKLVAMSIGLRLLECLAALACLLPAIWVTVRYGFTIEQRVLRGMGERRNERFASELIANALGDLIARWVMIFMFCILVWVSLALSVDQASTVLFKRPLVLGRLEVDAAYFDNPDHAIAYIFSFFWNDAGVVTFLLAVALAVYPLARLAWFFCLIDVRVRQDCWDMELQIQQEADRLDDLGRP